MMALKLSRTIIPPLSSCSTRFRRRETIALGTLQFCRTFIYTRPLPPKPSAEQPESHRPFDSRRTLLHRTYVSLLRSSPLLVFFQHNNLIPAEYYAIQEHLRAALNKADATIAANAVADAEGDAAAAVAVGTRRDVGHYVRMSILNGNILATALRAAEYMSPDSNAPASSRETYLKTVKYKKRHPLTPMIVGPIGVVEFPTLSPPHLQAVMELIFPEKIVAKKKSDPNFIAGLNKLVLLGAKIEGVRGSIADIDKVKWISTLGGEDTLRAQLVGILQQSAGQNLVQCLESPGRSIWFTMEGRRKMLEDEAGGGSTEAAAAGAAVAAAATEPAKVEATS